MIKNLLLKLFSHTLFLTLLLTSIIIFILPFNQNKYHAKLVTQTPKSMNENFFYTDLDGDKRDEQIKVIKTLNKITNMIVFKGEDIVDQWNLDGTPLGEEYLICVDLNNNGSKEVLFFSYDNNKIFLNIFNPLTKRYLVKNRVLTHYTPANNIVDCVVNLAGFWDANNDGLKELYFVLNAGMSKAPRSLYRYNFATDTLIVSPPSNAPLLNPIMMDMNSDGLPEIICSSTAVANWDSTAVFSDVNTWLTLYDANLNFKFSPQKVGHYPSSLAVKSIKKGTKSYLALLNLYNGIKKYPSSMALYTLNGERVKNRTLNNLELLPGATLFMPEKNNSLYLIEANGAISTVDTTLTVTPFTQLMSPINTKPLSLDLDNDGQKEHLFVGKFAQSLIITRNDFSFPLELAWPQQGRWIGCQLFKNGSKPPTLIITTEKWRYSYQYALNTLYYLKYPSYLAIFIVLYALIYFIQKAQRQFVERRFAAEKHIAELQLKAIKNQIDPHFTLNIINSIGSLFYKNDSEMANYVFGKYSTLLRATILGSENIITTIQAEIEYVETYLELEKFRLQNRFEYVITIEKNVKLDYKIPKMLIHTFVENAIKHGLRHKKAHGVLKIEMVAAQQHYTIKISDNGVGRQKGSESAVNSTRKGLGILQQILETYFTLTKIKIDYTIIDLKDDKAHLDGTAVIINVPLLKR